MNRFLALIFISVTISLCKINFNQDINLPSSPTNFLAQYHQIEAEGTSDTTDPDDFQTIYFKLIEYGKNKRNTYEYFTKKSKKLVQRLINNLYVPNAKIMIESPLQMIFNNKRRIWEFSKLYAVRIHISEIQKFQTVIAPFKIQFLKFQVDIQDKRLKLKIEQAFSLAKLETKLFLEEKYGSQVVLVGVKDINVKDFSYYNSDSNEQKSNKSSSGQRQSDSSTDTQRYYPKRISIRVTFEVDRPTLKLQKQISEQESKISENDIENGNEEEQYREDNAEQSQL